METGGISQGRDVILPKHDEPEVGLLFRIRAHTVLGQGHLRVEHTGQKVISIANEIMIMTTRLQESMQTVISIDSTPSIRIGLIYVFDNLSNSNNFPLTAWASAFP